MLVRKALHFRNGQKSPNLQSGQKVQIVLAGTIFTYSYIEGGQIGDSDFFVHSKDLDFVVKMHPTFAT